MARNMNDFPVELLRLVLQKVKSEAMLDRDGSFLNTLTTCRLWQQIGEEILWTDISLVNSQLKSFCTSTSWATSLTRTLSITINPYHAKEQHDGYDKADSFYSPYYINEMHYGVSSEVLGRLLIDLSKKVMEMQQLESFSIRVGPNGDDLPEGFGLKGRYLRALFDALPTSVRHFELEDSLNAIYEHSFLTPELDTADHLCLSFPKILPRLDNLRLRRGWFCEAMIPKEPTYAESRSCQETAQEAKNTFLINASCGIHRCPQKGSDLTVPQNAPSGCDLLIAYLKSAIAQTALSNFQQYSLIEVSKPHANTTLQYYTICERSLGAEEKLRKSPFYFNEDGGGTWTLRYHQANGNIAEVVGRWEKLYEFSEGQIWVETVEGYRLPSGYIERSSRFQGVELQPLEVIKPTELDYPNGFESWRTNPRSLQMLEKQEGHMLLLPESVDDLGEVDALTRHLTRKEQLQKGATEEVEAVEEGQAAEENEAVVEAAEEVEEVEEDSESKSEEDHDLDGYDTDEVSRDGYSDDGEWDRAVLYM